MDRVFLFLICCALVLLVTSLLLAAEHPIVVSAFK
jgi:hypothetical protein